jgi:hypothetical protein
MIKNFALIIGAGKCGTTSLYAFLSQHPQIAVGNSSSPTRSGDQGSKGDVNFEQKEIDFFTEYWDKGFEWYRGLWKNWNPSSHKIALEASPNYTKCPIRANAAERIASLKNKAHFKFIYLMRNPIDRIESAYTYSRGTKWSAGLNYYNNGEGIEDDFLIPSMYAMQLDQYYSRFPSSDIFLADFEDLKKNPEDLLQKICKFLDINTNFTFCDLKTIHNQSQGSVVDDSLWQLMRQIKILRSSTRHFFSPKQRDIIHGLFGRRVTQKFNLSPCQKKLILTKLKDDLYKLNLKYGVDISRWEIEGASLN